MKPMLITKLGCTNLGILLEKARRARGWSLDTLVDFIQQSTGETLSKTALSTLERGTVEPKFNTLAIIAAAGYVVNSEGISYSLQDLWLIACEATPSDHQTDALALSPFRQGRRQEAGGPGFQGADAGSGRSLSRRSGCW
jgi:transcriptional regulator with XRE-family HTH domain